MILEKPNSSIRYSGKVSPIQHKTVNVLLHEIRKIFKENIEIQTIPEIEIPFSSVTLLGHMNTIDRKDFNKTILDIVNISFFELEGKTEIYFNVIDFLKVEFSHKSIIVRPAPYFFSLCKTYFINGGFTSLPSAEILPLMSIYSLKFYELLKQYTEVERNEIVKPLTWIREWLKLEKKYELFKNFRVRVLESSHKEITEKTNLRYDVEFQKHGVKIHSIRFYNIQYTEAEPPQKPKETEKYHESAIEKKLYSVGVAPYRAKEISEQYPDEKFIDFMVDEVRKAKDKEKIDSMASVLVSTIDEKWRIWQHRSEQKSESTLGDQVNRVNTKAEAERERKKAEAEAVKEQKRIDAEAKAEYEKQPEAIKQYVTNLKKSESRYFCTQLHMIYHQEKNNIPYDEDTGDIAFQQSLILE